LIAKISRGVDQAFNKKK
jgi:hypothetical protein